MSQMLGHADPKFLLWLVLFVSTSALPAAYALLVGCVQNVRPISMRAKSIFFLECRKN